VTSPDVWLTVVVPAYNESSRIDACLTRILEYLNAFPHGSELIVVVDGATDDTVNRAEAAKPGRVSMRVIHSQVNHGKGYSVRRGMLAARGRAILFSDVDLSTPIEEVERLLAALEAGADVAIGSRSIAGADVRVRQPLWRQSMGRIFNWFVQRLALPGIIDSQCGFKCFRAEAASRIFERQRLNGFAFDVEVLFVARLLGYRIAEVPVLWINDPKSSVHPIRDSADMLKDLVRIRWRHLQGRYLDARDR
jgi:dolichyl-phosphate beta-glucosyltransferase